MNIERLVVQNLIRNEEFTRRALPHIRKEYFETGGAERTAFELASSYFIKYDRLPTPEALAIDLQNRQDLSDEQFNSAASLLGEVTEDNAPAQDIRYLSDQTESWCQDRALYLAMTKAMEIMAEKGGKSLSKGSIPKLMQDALAVSFDVHIGHDYFADAAKQYEYYHNSVSHLAFDLEKFNEITLGGVLPKTLNVGMAVSGAGKTLMMVHFAAGYLMMGKNVLYITHEIAEERIRERIDANLLDTDIPDLQGIPRDVYLRKIETMRNKTLGNLRIKEYPPHGAGAAHYRHLLHELRTKQGFVPDVIFVDYINICAATTLGKGDVNSYERVKRIAEELRGLAVESNVPIWSATQTNRGGYGSSDVGMEDVSDSMGLPMTVDLLFAIIRDETLDKLGQLKIVQLKSRYDDLSKQRVFFVGVNKVRMKLFDLEASAQPGNPEIVIPPTRIPGADKGGMKFTGFR